jgi:hypothetical protein
MYSNLYFSLQSFLHRQRSKDDITTKQELIAAPPPMLPSRGLKPNHNAAFAASIASVEAVQSAAVAPNNICGGQSSSHHQFPRQQHLGGMRTK